MDHYVPLVVDIHLCLHHYAVPYTPYYIEYPVANAKLVAKNDSIIVEPNTDITGHTRYLILQEQKQQQPKLVAINSVFIIST